MIFELAKNGSSSCPVSRLATRGDLAGACRRLAASSWGSGEFTIMLPNVVIAREFSFFFFFLLLYLTCSNTPVKSLPNRFGFPEDCQFSCQCGELLLQPLGLALSERLGLQTLLKLYLSTITPKSATPANVKPSKGFVIPRTGVQRAFSNELNSNRCLREAEPKVVCGAMNQVGDQLGGQV